MKQIKMVVSALGMVCEAVIESNDHEETTARECAGRIRSFLTELDDSLSVFKPDSDISRLNAAPGQAVRVSEETLSVLNAAKRLGSETEGSFDVTVGKSTDRWRQKLNGSPLEPMRSDLDSLVINEEKRTVRLASADIAVDLGGIAKGYAADHITEILLSSGFHNAMINLGGTVMTVGRECRIGIRNPFMPINCTGASAPFASVLCQNEIIVTSGTYEQHDEKGHHIMDPRTGMPSLTDLVSATVISNTGAEADAYATAMIVFGLKKSIEFSGQKGLSVILVDKNGGVYVSETLRDRFELLKGK